MSQVPVVPLSFLFSFPCLCNSSLKTQWLSVHAVVHLRLRSNTFGKNGLTDACRAVFSKQAAPMSHDFFSSHEPLPPDTQSVFMKPQRGRPPESVLRCSENLCAFLSRKSLIGKHLHQKPAHMPASWKRLVSRAAPEIASAAACKTVLAATGAHKFLSSAPDRPIHIGFPIRLRQGQCSTVAGAAEGAIRPRQTDSSSLQICHTPAATFEEICVYLTPSMTLI